MSSAALIAALPVPLLGVTMRTGLPALPQVSNKEKACCSSVNMIFRLERLPWSVCYGCTWIRRANPL